MEPHSEEEPLYSPEGPLSPEDPQDSTEQLITPTESLNLSETSQESPAAAGSGDAICDEVCDVISRLGTAGVPSCVVGAQALKHYGVDLQDKEIQEWDLCIPNDMLDYTRDLFLGTPEFQQADPLPPVPKSLRHTYPAFSSLTQAFLLILTPQSDCFLSLEHEGLVEKDPLTGVPYPNLVEFTRSLLVQQSWVELTELIGSMQLDVAWAAVNLDLEALELESRGYAKLKNAALRSLYDKPSSVVLPPNQLCIVRYAMESQWKRLVSFHGKPQAGDGASAGKEGENEVNKRLWIPWMSTQYQGGQMKQGELWI